MRVGTKVTVKFVSPFPRGFRSEGTDSDQLLTGDPVPGKCRTVRKAYEKSCPKAWVGSTLALLPLFPGR